MKNNERVAYGLILTAAIFLTATYTSMKVHLENIFFPGFVVSLTMELLLSVLVVFLLRTAVAFNISFPTIKNIWKPILVALAATIIINGLINIIAKATGNEIEIPAALARLQPIQIFLFVFIYASVAEELLFRGFLLNLLKPLNQNGVTLVKRKLSVPVIISAMAFGLAHLVLISTGVNLLFLIRIVVFTTCLGMIAGYYQEKHNNHAYAIIVHMAGNSLAVVAAFSMH